MSFSSIDSEIFFNSKQVKYDTKYLKILRDGLLQELQQNESNVSDKEEFDKLLDEYQKESAHNKNKTDQYYTTYETRPQHNMKKDHLLNLSSDIDISKCLCMSTPLKNTGKINSFLVNCSEDENITVLSDNLNFTGSTIEIANKSNIVTKIPKKKISSVKKKPILKKKKEKISIERDLKRYDTILKSIAKSMYAVLKIKAQKFAQYLKQVAKPQKQIMKTYKNQLALQEELTRNI